MLVNLQCKLSQMIIQNFVNPDFCWLYSAHIHRGDMASRDFASDFVDGFKKGFTGTLETLAPIALGFLRREDIDLLARQALAYVV